MISVVIPSTIGGLSHLAKLMPLLAVECADTHSEIIIVDNASHDGTGHYLSNYDCTVIHSKTNLGFSRSNNKAVGISKGEYILLLNNDTVITPGFLTTMRDTFDIDPKIGVVGSLIYRMDNKVQHAGVFFTDKGYPYELGLSIPDISEPVSRSDQRIYEIKEVPSVTACCMMVKRSVWDELGGLDERYINGWEDTDFNLRAKEKGYKIWYNGKSSIYHLHFGSKNAGRMAHENENRDLYTQIWIDTGRFYET